MTEDQARDWLLANFGAKAMRRLERFVSLLLAESAQQSLIARSTFATIWSRHIADSAQLVRLVGGDGVWLDVGSGGGLPGLVVALLRDGPVLLVEPRRKRADFLKQCASELALTNVRAMLERVQSVVEPASIISARAVAPIADIFTWTAHNVSRETTYLLPRGQHADADLAIARHIWHGTFHVKQSLTDVAAGIVVATDVRPR